MSFTFTGLLSSSSSHNNSLLEFPNSCFNSLSPLCSDNFPPGFSPFDLLNASLLSSSPDGFNWENISSEDEKNYSHDPSFETQTEYASLFESSSSMFQELEPQKKQDTLKINEPAKQTDFSSSKMAAPKFDYPSTQNFSSETALTKPETHGNSAPEPSCVHYTNTSRPNGGQPGAGDGYNWRKYGENQMRGSENPQSYYKCMQPNCLVTKKVEKALVGHITEIVYEGNHNHPKPEFTRRTSAQLTLQLSSSGGANSGNSYQSVREEDFEQTSPTSPPGGDEDELEQQAKRRKGENENGAPPASRSRAAKAPRVVVQTTSEVDILDDGYRWRKYGQKAVKGNPNPRSYYKCVSPGCSVKKHVERSIQNMKVVFTTYEGKHIHQVPEERGASSSSKSSNNMMNNNNNNNNNITSLNINNNISNNVVTAPTPIRPSAAVTIFSGSGTNFTNSIHKDTTMLPPPRLGTGNFGYPAFGKSIMGSSYTNQEQSSSHAAAYSATTDKEKDDFFLKSFLPNNF